MINKLIISLCFTLLLFNSSYAESTHKTDYPTLNFSKIVIPEAPPVASVMVAYMDIANMSNQKQTISSVSSEQFKRVEIHNMSMENDMMTMERLASLSINAGQTIALESNGLHVMLIKPNKPLRKGDKVELTFKLSSGEQITVSSHVKLINFNNHHHHHH